MLIFLHRSQHAPRRNHHRNCPRNHPPRRTHRRTHRRHNCPLRNNHRC